MAFHLTLDAFACTFGAEIATLPALSDWVQPHGAMSEYDPLVRPLWRGAIPML